MKRILLTFILLLTLTPAYAAETESVYERVMRTGTLRCGYGLWGNYLSKDPNTGAMSGIYYDLMAELGKNLSLKIEWSSETGWGDYIAGLQNDHFDAFCTFVAPNAERAREVDFLRPIFYVGSDFFVRADDLRFDNALDRLNDPQMTLTTVEGDIYSKITSREFPLAKTLPLGQLATESELFMTIATGKADAALTETSAGLDFMQHNPGKIRLVKLQGPFRALPTSLSIKGGEYRFQRMLDIAVGELISNGTVERILRTHEKYPGTFYPVAQPYKTTN